MSTRVVRSSNPQARESLRFDAAFVPGAVQQFIAAYRRLPPPPASLYKPENEQRFKKLTAAARRAIMQWCRAAPYRSMTWPSVFHPRVALQEQGQLIGFDMLYHSEKPDPGEGPDYPMVLDAFGTYSTVGAYPTFIFMLQNELQRHTSPRINLHVLSKGVRAFNKQEKPPVLRNPDTGLMEKLFVYVHTELNLDAYIGALIASEAFLMAAHEGYVVGKPRRRIVVPVLLTGHFQVFGWDRTFDTTTGAPLHDLLFCMTSMPPYVFPIDPHASDNILLELKKQLLDAQLLLPNNHQLMPYPGGGIVLRAMTDKGEFEDSGCFFLGVLYTFYLAMVEDLQADVEPAFAQDAVWNTFRSGYALYEQRLLHFLEAHLENSEEPVLLSSAFADTFLNIRSAQLLTPNTGYTYQYTWEHGWIPTQ